MALPGSAQPSPHVVGAAFVQQYYYILHKSPDLVHRFYQDSSILSRPDSDGMMTSVTTIQAINEKVLSMDFSEYTAEIESADSQASYKDGVLVVVTGSLTGRDNIRRKFTQSFFLAPQEGGYFVLNDIFRFIDLSQPSGANQVIVNGTIGDVSAAALTPEPEPTRVQEPQMATSVEHETSHTVEDIDKSEEIVKPTENDPPEGSIVVAAEEICMSEGLVRRKMKFLRFLRKRMNRKPTHGPIHFRAPAKILWRTIRGMIPHKTKRGAAALARLKAYEGVPPPYDKKRMVIPNALTVLRLQAGHKYCLLGKLSSQVVWGYYGTVKELELKRKQRAKVAYERKKQLSKLRLKAEKTAEEKL